MVKKEKR